MLELEVETNSWCKVEDRGLISLHEPTFEQWRETGSGLAITRNAIPFLIGDWINLGQGFFGERWSQATDVFGDYDYNTIANYASTCRKVDLQTREPDLSFSHHQAVAPLILEEQKYWLKRAKFDPDEHRPLTAAELRAKIKGEVKTPEPSPLQQIHKYALEIKERFELMWDLANQEEWSEIRDSIDVLQASIEDLIEQVKPAEVIE